MIPRYSRPAMAALWTDQAKYERWLQVEIAAVQAWAAEGVVPQADADAVAAGASFVLEDLDRYQAETHHDVTAFLRSVSDSLGDESPLGAPRPDLIRCLGHGHVAATA